MDRHRRFVFVLTALSLVCVVLQAVTGHPELTLYLTPLFLLAALLLSGHYVAEDAIVAGWRGPRHARSRRTEASRPHLRRELPLASLLARSPRTLRGPPALLAVSA